MTKIPAQHSSTFTSFSLTLDDGAGNLSVSLQFSGFEGLLTRNCDSVSLSLIY